ncbi:MAG: hypothetical protein ACLTZT_02465 [Butyricimonas faecalis]
MDIIVIADMRSPMTENERANLDAYIAHGESIDSRGTWSSGIYEFIGGTFRRTVYADGW